MGLGKNVSNANLSGASDVAFSGPVNNDVLQYNDTIGKWVNGVANFAPNLTPPTSGTDRVRMYDISASQERWFSLGSGLTTTGTVLSASGGGGGSTSTGFLYPEDYGCLNVPDVTPGTEQAQLDNMQACVDAAIAAGKGVWIGPDKEYYAAIVVQNAGIMMRGGGTLVQYFNAAGNGATQALRVTHLSSRTIQLSSQGVGYIGSYDGNDSDTVTRLTVAAANYQYFEADMPVLIRSSTDTYPWSNRPGGGSSLEYPVVAPVYLQDWVKILGLVLPVSLTGTVREGDTLTGATSGASAQVTSVGTTTVVLRTLNGTASFTSSESLRVGSTTVGTANGALWIAHKGLLDNTYTPASTSIFIMRPSLRVDVKDIHFKAQGDPFGPVGYAKRSSMLLVTGVVNPEFDITVETSYMSAYRTATCLDSNVKIRAYRLVNAVTTSPTSEGGYGYGVELIGAVVGGTFEVHGRNLRHAFTTNAWEGGMSSGTAEATKLLQGIHRDVKVTGTAHDGHNAGFDTHEGSMRVHFENCTVWQSKGAGRYQSSSYAFQNRALGTRYTNCHSIGTAKGFYTSSFSHRTDGFDNTIEYIDCSALDFGSSGLEVSQAGHLTDRTVLKVRNFTARGDGTTINNPSAQSAIILSGVDVDIDGAYLSGFNQDAILLKNANSSATTYPTIHIRNVTADYQNSPQSSSVNFIRVFGTQFALKIGSLFVLQKTTALSMPSRFVSFTSGSPTCGFYGEQITLNTSTITPRYGISSGSPTVGYVDTGRTRMTVGTTSQRPTDGILNDTHLDIVSNADTSAGTLRRYNSAGNWV